MKKSRAQVTEEKSLKLFQEKRAKDYEVQLNNFELGKDHAVIELKNQIDVLQRENQKLLNQVGYEID